MFALRRAKRIEVSEAEEARAACDLWRSLLFVLVTCQDTGWWGLRGCWLGLEALGFGGLTSHGSVFSPVVSWSKVSRICDPTVLNLPQGSGSGVWDAGYMHGLVRVLPSQGGCRVEMQGACQPPKPEELP